MQRDFARTDAHGGEDLERRILDFLRSGLPVPEDLVAALCEAREAAVTGFRELRADEALERLSGEIRSMESRVLALEEGSGEASGTATAAWGGLELGERMRWLASLVDLASGAPLRDPLSFVEDELDWVERSARDLRRWDEKLAAEAGAISRRVESSRAILARRRYVRFVEGVDPPALSGPLEAATAAWRKVEESFEIEKVLRRESPPDARPDAVRLEPRLPGREPRTPGDLDALETKRVRLFDAAREALAMAVPAEVGQFVRRGAADLLDQSSAVLSETATAKPFERIPALRSLRERIDGFLGLVSGSRREPSGLSTEDAGPIRKDLRQLARARRRARTAEREAIVRCRLEAFFGPSRVGLFESFTLVLIFAFLGLVVLESWLPDESPWLPAVHAADIALCAFFQVDFVVRWVFARWGGWYFLRHFFFESLPALPYGFLFHHLEQLPSLGGFEEARAVIIVRLLSLRSVLLVVIRAFRVLVFFVRGTDRAVEKFRAVLDRDVILFDSSALGDAGESPARLRLLRLEDRRRKASRGLYGEFPWAERPEILSRYLELLDVEVRARASMGLPYVPRPAGEADEIHLERVVNAFLDCDAARVTALVGHDGTTRIARWLRFFDVPFFRHGPVVRKLAPAARIASPPEAVAAAAHALGQLLQGILNVLRFWGDLAGITTGPQILDRIGTAVVTAASRPAMRLLLFAALFLAFRGFAELLGVPFLRTASEGLWAVLGGPLWILGSICFVFLLAGRWLRRIAGEALDIYLRTADAHFYPLLKTWKLGRKETDLRTLFRAVFLPELKLRGGDGASEEEWVGFLGAPVLESPPIASAVTDGSLDGRLRTYREDREIVTLLYRDFLDGPVLHRSDDKTSVQLLGNLVLKHVRSQTLGMRRRELRKLERLDLEKQRLLGLGPYFWFRFITESLAIETAKLVMEYNTSCIPLDELRFASPERAKRLEAFLESRRGRWDVAVERRAGKAMQCLGEPLATDEFTSLHFLTVDAAREEAIRRRHGEGVLAALRRDRQGMVRDIFGTRPYHLLPRSERSFNPYRIYHRYLGGAMFLLLPLVLLIGALRMLLAGLADVVRLVKDVLGREQASGSQPSRAAGFEVAVRKINRMRKPFFMEALKLRSAVDVEYLGLRLPGFERDDDSPSYREDLDFIGALEGERRPIELSRAAALRDLRRFRGYLAERGWSGDGFKDLLGGLDPSGELIHRRGEVMRALVTAYVTDHESLRSILTSRAAARKFVERAMERREALGRRAIESLRNLATAVLSSCRRRRRIFAEYRETEGELKALGPRRWRKALRAFLRAPPETERIFALAVRCSGKENGATDAVKDALASVAVDHVAWTRKIMRTRALQAITVLDIQCYRDLVWEAGEYEKG